MAILVVRNEVHGKHADPRRCEDLAGANAGFAVVVDGATPKSELAWAGGATSGRRAAELLLRAALALPRDISGPEAVVRLTATLREEHEREGRTELVRDAPRHRLTASLVMYSDARREVWSVGDAQARIGDCWIQSPKEIDQLMAGARAAWLHLELARGRTVEELRRDDPGRSFIQPLLERQGHLQNNPSGSPALWYPVFDGTEVPAEGVRIEPVGPDVTSVILATDGYPILASSYEESEAARRRILADDPLMIGAHRACKAHAPGLDSFDDRAFLQLDVATRPAR